MVKSARAKSLFGKDFRLVDSPPRPIILDMDPGVDDALALLLALASPEVDVRAVTTVAGNVPVGRGTDNALRVLELPGRTDVPVHGGADRPLEGNPVHAEHIHGRTGLGEAQLPRPRMDAQGGAAERLIHELSTEPASVDVVATGPLTNLAIAERGRAGVLRLAKQVIVMGGAVHETGNATPTAEFNFRADPVAAKEVLNSGANLLLVPLDATRQVLLSPEQLEEIVSGAQPEMAHFARAATATPMATARRKYGYEGLYLHDVLAVALAVRPQLATQTETTHLDVETRGDLTMGQVVADERPFTDPSQ